MKRLTKRSKKHIFLFGVLIIIIGVLAYININTIYMFLDFGELIPVKNGITLSNNKCGFPVEGTIVYQHEPYSLTENLISKNKDFKKLPINSEIKNQMLKQIDDIDEDFIEEFVEIINTTNGYWISKTKYNYQTIKVVIYDKDSRNLYSYFFNM